MKYIKMLGLAAIAAAAMMAFAGSASATIITSPEGTPFTGTIEATSTHTSLHPGSGTSFLTVTCEHSFVKGTIEKHGAAVTAEGPLSELTFSKCTDPVTVAKPGRLVAHTIAKGTATLTSVGAEVLIHTSEGPTCTFTTGAGVDIGVLEDSKHTGGNATLNIGSSSIPASGFLCPSTGVWTGDYKVTAPSKIYVD